MIDMMTEPDRSENERACRRRRGTLPETPLGSDDLFRLAARSRLDLARTARTGAGPGVAAIRNAALSLWPRQESRDPRHVTRSLPRVNERLGGPARLGVEYRVWMVQRGAYPADRAAALSGVPLSTVHWWARHDVLVPSISAQKIKLWSYPDLMGLRVIYWLRQVKEAPDGVAVPRTAMPAVRRALSQLAELDLRLWSEETGPAVRVDRGGNIIVTSQPDAEAPNRQRALDAGSDDLLSVIDPFRSKEGTRGPDLLRPRPLLRIVPGKLGGSPHVAHTRLESQALGALAASGLSEPKIYQLYPGVEHAAIDEALDLERQLEHNLRPALAA